jgi:hypothetical protein
MVITGTILSRGEIKRGYRKVILLVLTMSGKIYLQVRPGKPGYPHEDLTIGTDIAARVKCQSSVFKTKSEKEITHNNMIVVDVEKLEVGKKISN